MQIGDVSRVSLGEFPTPIQKLDNLSNKLDGPEILIKRDDMNGLGTGGNKLRKLEFEMAKAKEEGATVLITTGAVQTNHGRLTLAAANKLNLKTVLVLTGEEPENFSGNILLDKIMGVEEIHFVEDSQQAVDQRVNSIEERLTGEGENPYYIPVGCDPLYGTLGYATCVMELVNQLGMNHKAPDYIVTASGTTSTQSGLVLGSRLFTRDQLEVVGISVSYHERSRDKDVSDYANQAADFLGLEESFSSSNIIALDDYVG
ncbi:pyridoxal-phosphate dependent enzyme, partial [Candidatus Bipolaricaulota bacterium]|nr:pyridoxal-phosphate dependent enzyme [Candidatus Bipolaricaulota bacterium]